MSEAPQPAPVTAVPAPKAKGMASNTMTLSLYACGLVMVVAQIISPRSWHWFMIPLALCGLLVIPDALDWLRGNLDLLDPVGILGVLGVHFFLLAPILQVAWDHEMRYIVPPPDWRPWLGAMAILNLAGLLVYRYTRGKVEPVRAGPAEARTRRAVWELHPSRFPLVLIASLVVSLALQAWVYHRFDGVLGYIRSFEAQDSSFEGMGWIFVVSESFPLLAFFGYAALARRVHGLRSWAALVPTMLVFLGLKLLFGGLRGSRSNTIWGVFWAVGIIHLWIRPISRRLIFVGLVLMVAFMYVYGFYKSGGLEGLGALTDAASRAEFSQDTGRSLEGVLLQDLGRSDVQAFLLYRLVDHSDQYRYALGRTYVGAAALVIPRSVWPARPPTKTKEGTEAQYGMGTWDASSFHSSRVYGLAGETMLNFGPLAVPLAFTLLGLLVRWVRSWQLTMDPSDARLLLFPVLVNLCFVVLTSDSDNILFFVIKNASIPFAVVLASCRRRPQSAPAQVAEGAVA